MKVRVCRSDPAHTDTRSKQRKESRRGKEKVTEVEQENTLGNNSEDKSDNKNHMLHSFVQHAFTQCCSGQGMF